MSHEDEDADVLIGPLPTPEQVGGLLDQSVDALSALVVAAKKKEDVVQAAQDISEVIQTLTNSVIVPIAYTQSSVQEELTTLLVTMAEDIVELISTFTEYSSDSDNRAQLLKFEASARKVGVTILTLSKIIDVSFRRQELEKLSASERVVEEARFAAEQEAQQEAYENVMSTATHGPTPKILEEMTAQVNVDIEDESQILASRKIVEANVEFASVADELVQLAGNAAEDLELSTRRAELVSVIEKTEHASEEVKQDPSNPSKQVALTMCVKTLADSVQKTEIYQGDKELSEALQDVKSQADTVVEDLTNKGLVVFEEKDGEVVISAPPVLFTETEATESVVPTETPATTSQELVAPKAVSIPDITNLKISVVSPPPLDENSIAKSTRSGSVFYAKKVRAFSTSVKVVSSPTSSNSPTPTAPVNTGESSQPAHEATLPQNEVSQQPLEIAATAPPLVSTSSIAFAQATPTAAIIFHRANFLTSNVHEVIEAEESIAPAVRVEKMKEMSKEMQMLSRKITEISVGIKDDKTRKKVVGQSKLIQDRALQLKIIMSVKAAGSDDDPAHDSQVKAAAVLLEQAVYAVHSEMQSLDRQNQLQNTVGQVVAMKKAVDAFKKLQKK